jgi:hypothetical protein
MMLIFEFAVNTNFLKFIQKSLCCVKICVFTLLKVKLM